MVAIPAKKSRLSQSTNIIWKDDGLTFEQITFRQNKAKSLYLSVHCEICARSRFSLFSLPPTSY